MRIIQVTVLFVALLVPPWSLAQEWIYVVKPGDTLWQIGQTYLNNPQDQNRLQAHNALTLTNPDLLVPGMSIRIPVSWLKWQLVSARVMAFQGRAEVLSNNDAPRQLIIGYRLSGSDRVQTGPNSSMLIEFSDGARVLIEPDSLLDLIEVRGFAPLGIGKTQLHLKHGGLEAEVPPKKQRAGSRFEILTSAATLGVRGTRFRARAPNDQPDTMTTEVLRGAVAAAGAGTEVVVPTLFGTMAREGEPPVEPVELLPAPDLAALPERIRQTAPPLAFASVTGAAAYRYQFFLDPAATVLAIDGRSTMAQIDTPTLTPGEYLLRVRAIDTLGLEGLNANHRLVVDAALPSPQAVAPVDGAIIRTPAPQLQWQAVAAAANEQPSYQVQLAANADFTTQLLQTETLEIQLHPDIILAPGEYYWRLATSTEPGTTGVFGAAQRFVIGAPPETPTLQSVRIVNEGLQLRWHPIGDNQRVRAEIATDQRFDMPMTHRVADPGAMAILVPPIAPGRYYLRLRLLDPDGFTGNFSAPTLFYVPKNARWELSTSGAVSPSG